MEPLRYLPLEWTKKGRERRAWDDFPVFEIVTPAEINEPTLCGVLAKRPVHEREVLDVSQKFRLFLYGEEIRTVYESLREALLRFEEGGLGIDASHPPRIRKCFPQNM
jgi:hypothetical protein